MKRRWIKKSRSSSRPRTLAIDVGGTWIKASIIDCKGKMLADKVRVATPRPCSPKVLLDVIAELVAPLPRFDRISIGFPGFIRRGVVVTAPPFNKHGWEGCPLARNVSKRLGKPVRLLNDADVHGFGLVSGHGLEVVLTLGTGAGTAVFRDGDLMPHLELAQHPIHNGETYNDYIGDKALRRLGMKKWNSRVRSAIAMLKTLLQYDVLYLGGGNAARIVGPPKGVRIGSNDAALIGGIRMWDMESGYFGGARRGTSSSKRYLKPVGQSG